MARNRSKSVVQKIAKEVPTYSNENHHLESESNDAKNVHNPTLPYPKIAPTQYSTRNRAKSLDAHRVTTPRPVTPLYPFTEAEKDVLWLAYLDKLNYNSVLDSEYIDGIHDLVDDSALAFKADCDLNINHVRTLIGSNKSILENLNSLMFQYDKVAKGTQDFATQATLLLNKQEELETKTAQMDHILTVFEPLERISKTLVSSGNHIIKTGKLARILEQLQECLDFLDAHKSYKDSEVYTIRYRQCMTRGLTLVRNYLIEYLRSKTTQVSAKLQEKDLTSLTLDIYMYSEFTSELDRQDESTSFPVLVGEIVDKCATHAEYQGLVSDVLQQYFRLRLQFVPHYVLQQQLPDKETSMVVHCQRSIAVFKKLLEKEYTLFTRFFPLHQWDPLQHQFVLHGLYSFFKEVLEPLYDDVRNKILREHSISELCHLTNLLTSYFDFDDAVSVATAADPRIEYGVLFEPMLNDAQARLIFRIQNYIDNKLVRYRPQPEDLQLGSRKKERRDSVLDEFDENLFPALYVPVGIALTILSSIYELVHSMVFDDIAHYIVHSCIYMLRNGAMKLAVAHLGPVDATLFYLKNLIALKNQLANFDIQFVRTETSLDFTSGILELIHIFRSGELYVTYNEEGLLELVKRSVPKVINNMIDAQNEIELELSNAVNEFVTKCTNLICAPVVDDTKQTLKEKAVLINDNVLMKIPHYYSQIKVFIDEDDIVKYLVDMLSGLVATTYENFYKVLEARLDKNDLNPEEMDDVMEPETFFNFLNETISGLFEADSKIEFNTDVLGDVASLESAIESGSEKDPLEPRDD